MLSIILGFYDKGLKAIEDGVYVNEITSAPSLERLGRMKEIPEDKIAEIDELKKNIYAEIDALAGKRGKIDA